MLDYLYLLPALPGAAFVVLAVLGKRLSQPVAAWVGVAPTAAAAAVTLAIAAECLAAPPRGGSFRQTLWTWLAAENFRVDVAFYLDPLAIVMAATVAVVAVFVLLHAVEYMAGDDGFSRFFAVMNLFVAAMLVLVLADNLLLLYVGWEGVGLCSYLLIGFWKRDPANGRAARKAFLVTRVGDTALLIGIVFLLVHLGTLDIHGLQVAARNAWAPGAACAVLAAAMMLAAAVAKSAQWPMHIWLPDAMAGPTPVSALLHAATMVTAGVYLVARLGVLFTLAPAVQWATAGIGSATMLLGGAAALTQTDLKRALAYSTMSQIGLMFAALGVGAATAAIFHFLTHAVFKSLLFLAAGSVMLAVGHSSDMARMGGLRRSLPRVYVAFLAGAAALAGLPFFSGFFSKEAILAELWSHGDGAHVLWAVGLAGAFLTAWYAFRLVFLVFHGPARVVVAHRPTWVARVPMLSLAALAVLAGWVQWPGVVENGQFVAHFLDASFDRILPSMSLAPEPTPATRWMLLTSATAAAIAGATLAWWTTHRVHARAAEKITQPASLFTRVLRYGVADRAWRAVAFAGLWIGNQLARMQTGRVRWYAATLAAVTVLAVLAAVFL
ncbi:MAG: NADH-quinone oxidoreductase subunit L [Phycisphaerae bacterium]|nr:NADH-quinone oxidoreductase subunit L [Phycisphaerae bacterium]